MEALKRQKKKPKEPVPGKLLPIKLNSCHVKQVEQCSLSSVKSPIHKIQTIQEKYPPTEMCCIQNKSNLVCRYGKICPTQQWHKVFISGCGFFIALLTNSTNKVFICYRCCLSVQKSDQEETARESMDRQMIKNQRRFQKKLFDEKNLFIYNRKRFAERNN